MNRRDFLRGLLGAGIATAAAPAIVEPVRRIWQVGVQLERPGTRSAGRWGLDAAGHLVLESTPGPLDGWEPLPNHAAFWRPETGETQTFAERVRLVEDMRREGLLTSPEDVCRIIEAGPDERLYMLREPRSREDLAAMYPEPSVTFAEPTADANGYTARDRQEAFAAAHNALIEQVMRNMEFSSRIGRELMSSVLTNPETAPRGGSTRS